MKINLHALSILPLLPFFMLISSKINRVLNQHKSFETSTLENMCHPDYDALISIYDSTNGPDWINNAGWLTDCEVCNWFGVGCDTSGRVISLDLPGNNLTGTLSSNVGYMTFLENLELRDNHISGEIPASIINLTQLKNLQLGNNQLTGSIPASIGLLGQLRDLALYDNDISGYIPESIGSLTNLIYLYLQGNQLTGSIPASLGNLNSLINLGLQVNQLSGTIPESLGNLSNLKVLSLDANQLSGSIPSSLGNLHYLEGMWLFQNQLTGSIPSSLGNLINLDVLNLGNNQLSGSIPDSLGNLSELDELVLYNNQLTGCLPVGLSALCNHISHVNLWGNPDLLGGGDWEAFCSDGAGGCICGDTVGTIYYLDADNDGYAASTSEFCTPPGGVFKSGPLPLGDCNDGDVSIHPGATDTNCNGIDENCDGTPDDGFTSGSCLICQNGQIGHHPDYNALQDFYFNTNGMNWTNNAGWLTDCDVCNWVGVGCNGEGRVIHLNLVGNNLSGIIPGTIGDLTNLEYLALSGNQLTGTLPPSLGNLSNLQALDLGANQMWGFIPASLNNLTHLTELLLYNNQFSGGVPDLNNLSALQNLSLSDNLLTGTIAIQFNNLLNLTNLDLRNNQLSGSIPINLGNLSSLNQLELGNNQFSGSIPSVLGNLSNLSGLALYNNQLSGPIPSSLGNLSNLEILFLQNNQFTGSIPGALGNLTNILGLNLGANLLSGSIPPSLGNLSNLGELILGDNQLTGSIPSTLANLSNLYLLFLNGNQLTGCFPVALSGLCNQLSNANFFGNPGLPGNGDWDAFCSNNNGACLCGDTDGTTYYLDADNDGYAISMMNFCSSPGGGYKSGPLPLGDCNDSNGSIHPGAADTNCNGIDEDCDGVPDDEYVPVNCLVCQNGQASLHPDYNTLVDFYNSTQGGSWINNSAWLLDCNVCSWAGVICNGENRVIGINLPANNLSGTLPGSLGNLTYLEFLELRENQLTGSIPTSIVNLTNLRDLQLGDNQLSGSIPADIGNLTQLTNIGLYSNQLNGALPESLGSLTGLIYLYLANNAFTGSIPNSFGNLTNLINLGLEANQLTGPIPASFGNLASLRELGLNNNQINGSIPSTLGSLSNLERLFLYSNQLSGSIPETLGNLSNLKFLSLDENQLTGTIPASFGNLSNLEALWMANNQLSGNIPAALGNLSNLHILFLGFNQLTGQIPASLGNLPALEELVLENNQLSGCLPSSLHALCGNINYVNLYGNPGLAGEGDWDAFCSTNQGQCLCGDQEGITYYLDADEDGYAVSTLLACSVPDSGYSFAVLPLGDCNDSLAYVHPGGTDTTCNGIDEDCNGINDDGYVPVNCLICQNGQVFNNSQTWYLDADHDQHAFSSIVACTSPDSNYTSNVLPIDDCNDNNPSIYLGAADDNCNGIDEDCDGIPDDGYVPVNCLTCQNGQVSPHPDYNALVDFFNSTNGPTWTNNTGWLSDCDVCSWYGITCNASGRVRKITLTNNNLSGSITSSLGNILTLNELFLSNNFLTGSIPSSFGDLVSLRFLYLDNNQLTGLIPMELGSLSNLSSMILNNNQLSGPIPASFGSSLSNLDYLHLGHNQLSGTIPSALGDFPSILSIELNHNQFSGQIPNTLAIPPNLVYLYLNNNQLSGCLAPELLALCSKLINANISGNAQLPEGGDWTAFCSDSMGMCCINGGIEIGWYLDADGDDHASSLIYTCSMPGQGYTSDSLPFDDCNDNNPSIYPGAVDTTCNGIDENCNGITDEGFAAVNCLTCQNGQVVNTLQTWYLDADNDQHAISFTTACTSPGLGYTLSVIPIDDCNDNNNSIHPGASDTNCNGMDEDCDGTLDDNYVPVNCLTCQSGQATQHPDYNLLTDFYNSTNGTGWLNSEGWLSSCNICDWFGVTCDSLGRVSQLNLSGNNLVGTIPSSLGNLVNLNALILFNNNLSGTIPGSLGNLVKLVDLNLSINQFIGSIPNSLGNLLNLIELKISNNMLAGIIPASIGNISHLQKLNLSHNQLSGEIPVSIGNLSNLTQLILHYNQFTGAIPEFIGELENLEILYLGKNSFMGTIPETFGNLSNLIQLVLYYCQLSGPIPASLGNLSQLSQLYLSNNQLTGSIPAALGNLSNLGLLDLGDNQLSGCFPSNLSALCSHVNVRLVGNPGLPGGGDWASFCDNSNAGGCLCGDTNGVTYFLDADNDGHAISTLNSCNLPGGGYTSFALPIDDCNDNNAFIYPGAIDTTCNGIDENCNGITDEGFTAVNCLTCQNGQVVNTSQTWYLDADHDQHALSSIVACTSPGSDYTSTVLPINDCNDNNPSMHPGAADDNCNGIDEDCDGTADEGYVLSACQTCLNGQIHSSGPPIPVASATKQPTCTAPTGTITVSSPTTGHTYSFDNGTTFQASRIKSGLSTGTYHVKVKSNASGCISTSAEVVINDLPENPSVPNATVSAQPTCLISTGTITVTNPVSGHRYSFDNGLNFQSSRIMDSLAPGTYQIVVMSISTGCNSPALPVVVNLPPNSGPAAPVGSVTKQPTCTSPTGTITVSNPTTGHTYSFDNGISFQTSRTLSGLMEGSYMVKVKSNATGCISDAVSFSINGLPANPSAPAVIVLTQPTCAVQTGTLRVTDTATGYKFSFDNGSSFQTSKTKTGLAPGSYQVLSQSNTTGCVSQAASIGIDPVPTTGPPAPMASVTKQPTCTTPTGTITVTNPTTGHTYSFDNGINFQTSRIASGLVQGTYLIKIKSNATGCISDSISLDINGLPAFPASPTVVVQTQPTCAVQTGTLRVTDTATGFKYSFDNGINFQTSKTKSGLAPGDYQVLSQSNTTGCVSPASSISIDSVPTTGPPVPIASVTKQPTCTTPTGTITVSNPTTGHTYSFDDGASFQTSRVKSGLPTASYLVKIKSNTTGCISEAITVVVDDLPTNPLPPNVIVSVQPTCAVQTGTLKVTDTLTGYKYSFDNGITFQTSKTKTGLAPGLHQVIAQSNATGCISSATSVNVDEVPTTGPAAPIASATKQPTCASPTGTITVSSPTTGHTYSFDNGISFQSSRVKSGLATGNYILKIKSNATGCLSDTVSIEINELPPPPSIPTASVTVMPTCVSQLGTIVVSNPTAGHTYSFNDGISFQTSRTKSNLSPNLYLVRVKANNTGCISPAVIISLDSAICAPLASIKPGTLEPKKNTFTQGPVINKSIPYGSLSIYPNPASSFFSIDLVKTNTTEEVTIRMSDQFGRVVKQLKRNTAQLRQESFNTYEFHSGQYFIEVISQERRYPVKRLVILK